MKRKTRKMIAVGLIFGAAASSAFAAEPKGGIPDETKGVVLSQEESAPDLKTATTCTLDLPDNVVQGQTFSFAVNYSPCRTGGRVESFTFLWPSTLPPFTEKTVREKLFLADQGCISGSSDITVAPSAGAISGIAKVRVDVQGKGFRCSATRTMKISP